MDPDGSPGTDPCAHFYNHLIGYSDVDHAHDDWFVLFTLLQQDTHLSIPPAYAGQINATGDRGLRHLL